MTTTVTVEASSHDVEVVHEAPSGTFEAFKHIVRKGEKRVFYAHQTQDIKVQEIRDV